MHKSELLVSILQQFFVRKADDDDRDVTIKSITATTAGYTITTKYNIHSISVLQSATGNPCIKWGYTIYQCIDGTWVPVCTL